MIYFDNSATTRPLDEVTVLVSSLLGDCYGNPASLHALGVRADKLRHESVTDLAKTAGCKPDELVITSGGTESINMAIRGYLAANPRAGRHLISSEGEHPAVLETMKHLSGRGYDVTLLPLESDGCVNMDRLAETIRPDTALLSLFHVNNETGAMHDYRELARIRDRTKPGMVLHMDSVQAFCKIPMRLSQEGYDLVSFSGHKFHATKGVGGLFVRSGIRMSPILHGGGQQRGLRSGTENTPMLAGMALAARIESGHMDEASANKTLVRDTLMRQLERHVRHVVLSPPEAYPGILNIAFPELPAETMLHALEMEDIYVSAGAACSSRKKVGSPVLRSMGIASKTAGSAIRFSFCAYNTIDEAKGVADAVVRAMARFAPGRGQR